MDHGTSRRHSQPLTPRVVLQLHGGVGAGHAERRHLEAGRQVVIRLMPSHRPMRKCALTKKKKERSFSVHPSPDIRAPAAQRQPVPLLACAGWCPPRHSLSHGISCTAALRIFLSSCWYCRSCRCVVRKCVSGHLPRPGARYPFGRGLDPSPYNRRSPVRIPHHHTFGGFCAEFCRHLVTSIPTCIFTTCFSTKAHIVTRQQKEVCRTTHYHCPEPQLLKSHSGVRLAPTKGDPVSEDVFFFFFSHRYTCRPCATIMRVSNLPLRLRWTSSVVTVQAHLSS